MKVLITSGGTREYIDGVRVLTNISTGKLGKIIAEKFIQQDFISKLSFIRTPSAKELDLDNIDIKADQIEEFVINGVDELDNIMEVLVPVNDIIIHLMAVSDFKFKPLNDKLKSNDPEAFIESLKDRIELSPKILPKIKHWNKNCFLVSFKFENSGSRALLLKYATNSMKKASGDIVVANDKQMMIEKNTHNAFIIERNYTTTEVNSKDEIADALIKIIKHNLNV